MLPDNPASRVILLVGTMSWEPNVEAADYFLENVWPRVRQTVPDAEFQIIGTDITAEMRQRWSASPGVKVIGFVEKMAPAYAACAFTVVPIFSGAGTNVKLVDTLANGRTCVVSPYGHRGYEADFRHLDSLYLTPDAESFARGCIELLQNPALRATMAQRGAAVAAERYSFDAFRGVVAETVSQVMADARRTSHQTARTP